MVVLRCIGLFVLLAAGATARDTAQPPLPTVTLTVGGHKVVAEVADEEHERSAGLMFREELEDGRGMLFVMPSSAPASFWMKNTVLPLSIAYISEAGAILEIHDLEPGLEEPVRSRFANIAYALEVRRGWFEDMGVLPGDRVAGLPAAGGR